MTPPSFVIYEDDLEAVNYKYPVGKEVPLNLVIVNYNNLKKKDPEPPVAEFFRERLVGRFGMHPDIVVQTVNYRRVSTHVPPQADFYFVDGLEYGVFHELLEKLPRANTDRVHINSLSEQPVTGYIQRLGSPVTTETLEWLAGIKAHNERKVVERRARRRR